MIAGRKLDVRKVEQLIADTGWELGTIAAMAKINRSTMWRLMNDGASPTEKTLRGLAKALGVKVAERHTLLEPTEADTIRAKALAQGVKL